MRFASPQAKRVQYVFAIGHTHVCNCIFQLRKVITAEGTPLVQYLQVN